MNIYMKRRNRLVGIIVSIAIIFTCVFNCFSIYNVSTDVYASGNTLELNASDLKAGKYPEYYDVNTKTFNITNARLLILNMDDTLHVNYCDIDAALIINGNRTLFIDESVCVCGNVTINDNAGVAFNKSESGLYILSDSDKVNNFTCFGNIIASGNQYAVITGDAEFELGRGSIVAENLNDSLFSIAGDIYIDDGSVDLKNVNNFARCRDFYFCGGDIKADTNSTFLYAEHVAMTGGKIDVYSHENASIYASKEISVSGSEVKATSADNSAFYSKGAINITGGYVEAVSELNDHTDDISGYYYFDKTYSPIDAEKEIIIGDDYCIAEPVNGIIKKEYDLSRIVASDGLWVRRVVVQKNAPSDDPSKDDPSKDDSKDNSKDDSSKDNSDKKDGNNNTNPSNEWIDGKWYESDGSQVYKPTGSWKSDANGWWYEDTSGWYPQSQWQKIDGKWYYFCADGYMDYSEYRDGCWLGADGAWVEDYYGGHWMSDSNGWWYEDSSGWYPYNQYLWIDGVKYWFGNDGYWV